MPVNTKIPFFPPCWTLHLSGLHSNKNSSQEVIKSDSVKVQHPHGTTDSDGNSDILSSGATDWHANCERESHADLGASMTNEALAWHHGVTSELST